MIQSSWSDRSRHSSYWVLVAAVEEYTYYLWSVYFQQFYRGHLKRAWDLQARWLHRTLTLQSYSCRRDMPSSQLIRCREVLPFPFTCWDTDMLRTYSAAKLMQEDTEETDTVGFITSNKNPNLISSHNHHFHCISWQDKIFKLWIH